MDFYEVLEKRQSVRFFEAKPVEEGKLQRILEAARLAPSGNNRQAYKLIVVRDAKVRQALSDAADQPFVAKAAVIIIAVGLDPQRLMFCGIPADPVDCAIALEHVALAATAEGLGGCWIGHFNQAACCNILGIPQNARIIEMYVMGYPAEQPSRKPRKAIHKVVSFDQFQDGCATC